jgi:PD-(D/E)XK endonuclease
MEHPKTKGDLSTLAIILALRTNGFDVSVPFGENTRYDLIIDDGTTLGRVQCKTGRLRRGAVIFNACSYYAHHPNPKVTYRNYLGQIDFFAVCCRETSQVYLIPIGDIPLGRAGTLRVDPPRNNQRRRIRFARDYAIATISVEPTRALRESSGAG